MIAYPRRTGSPVTEPITLEEALHHIKVVADGGANDAYVLDLISTAREACEDRIHRTLIETPWRLTLDAFPCAFRLYQSPVIAVQAVGYVDEEGVTRSLDLVDCKLDKESEPGYLVPAYGRAWPATRSEPNAVWVDYTAGMGSTAAAVPRTLKRWMLLAIGDMYDIRRASSDKPTVKHNFVDAYLDPHKFMGD